MSSAVAGNLARLFWGITGGAAAGVLLFVVPYLLLASAVSFTTGDEGRVIFYIWGICLVAAGYIVLAVTAHRRIGKELRLRGNENPYAARSFLLGLALPFILFRIGSEVRSRSERRAGVEYSQASDAARGMLACAQAFAQRHPETGFPKKQGDLDCRLNTRGSRLTYVPDPPDANGRIQAFRIRAEKGRTVVIMNERGTVTREPRNSG